MNGIAAKFLNNAWVKWTLDVMCNITNYDMDKIESWLTILAGFLSAILLLIAVVFMILTSMFMWLLAKAVVFICNAIVELCS